MKIVLEIFTVLLMAIPLVGCHPHMLHMVKSDMGPGPERPKDEIAVIKGDGHMILYALLGTKSLAGIHMVDGEVVKTDIRYDWSPEFPDADEVRVLPGPHEVVIRITKSMWMPGQFGEIEALKGARLLIYNFDTKAGHTYKVDIPTYWEKNSVIRIIDEATKEVVASEVIDYYAEF